MCGRNPETGERLRSCTMLITEPNKLAAEIHDRMPVILEPENFEAWLSGEGKDLLKSAVSDAGSGVPAAETSGTGAGLGTRIVETLARQIDATIAKDCSPAGYTVTLRVPHRIAISRT
jgi:SOS response associated peptidase (SRAP)